MKVTFLLKDLYDCFYEELLSMEDSRKKLEYLEELSSHLPSRVKMKVGLCDQFKEKLELGGLKRKGFKECSFKLSPRRGYKLATFIIS